MMSALNTGQVLTVPGEHDSVDDGGQKYRKAFGAGTAGEGWYSFDAKGVHFISLVNTLSLEKLGHLGADQLDFIRKDVAKLSSDTPIAVFSHIPLFEMYPAWGWGTGDATEALSYLRRFSSATCLNGHVHQLFTKTEGNVTFHSATTTAYPLPAPGTAPAPAPVTLPAGKLGDALGIREVAYRPAGHYLLNGSRTAASRDRFTGFRDPRRRNCAGADGDRCGRIRMEDVARRSLITLVALAVIGLVLLPADSNIAANAVPDSWKPYLWLAWPLGVLLAVPLIGAEISDRRRAGEFARTGEEQARMLDRAAGDLADAVRRQWLREAGLRSLRSPEPILVRWLRKGRPMAAEPRDVLPTETPPDDPIQVSGDVHRIFDVLDQVQARQLVILGRPAAGKSVAAMLLTLAAPRTGPVPVLLSVSSWNPREEDLPSWLAGRIAEEYPALGNPAAYGAGAVPKLIAGRRIMPVLDGLDEVAEILRPIAIDMIERSMGADFPFVLTCRSAEYHEAVTRNGRILTHAAVLEIQPVTAGEAGRFLVEADPRPERWRPVLDHLAAEPGGPLADVLRSPLMIDLTRTVYREGGGDPGELAGPARFSGRAALEEHLFDSFLRVVYSAGHVPPGSQPGARLARYSPERAHRWLEFLAGHLRARGEPDLAWWRIVESVSPSTRGALIGFVAGLLAGGGQGLLFGAGYGLVFFLTFGLAAGFAFGTVRPRPPSRIAVGFRHHGQQLLRRSAIGVVIGAGLTPVAGIVDGVAAAVVLTVALAVHLWLHTPPEVTTAATPMAVLSQDRQGALALGVMLALALGAMAGLIGDPAMHGRDAGPAITLIGVAICATAGAVVGGFIIGRTGMLAFGLAGAVTGVLTFAIGYEQLAARGLFGYGLVLGLTVGALSVASRAWGLFLLTRGWLALCGRLPLRLMRFLDDGHRRGVLRQSGTVYQFRHDRLCTHIVATSLVTAPPGGDGVGAVGTPCGP